MEMLTLRNLGYTFRIAAPIILFMGVIVTATTGNPLLIFISAIGSVVIFVASQFSIVFAENSKEQFADEIKPKGRPDLLTVIATLFAIGGLLNFVATILALSLDSQPELLRGYSLGGMRMTTATLSVYLILLAGIQGYIAYGLWNLRSRAWNISIALLVYGILNTHSSSTQFSGRSGSSDQTLLIIATVVGILINFLILLYLTKNKHIFVN